MLAWITATDHRTMDGLHCDRFEVGVLAFEEPRRTSDRSARANAGNNGVNLLAAVLPDLWTSGLLVDSWVGRIFELLRHESVRVGGEQFASFSDRSFHAFSSGS